MITRLSIAFEDFLGSSIAPQVMPRWIVYSDLNTTYILDAIDKPERVFEEGIQKDLQWSKLGKPIRTPPVRRREASF